MGLCLYPACWAQLTLFQVCKLNDWVFAILISIALANETTSFDPSDVLAEKVQEAPDDYWTNERIKRAIANSHHIIFPGNNEAEFNRSRRWTSSFFWTEDRVRKAQPMFYEPSRSFLSQIGVDYSTLSNIHIPEASMQLANRGQSPWNTYGRLFASVHRGESTCTAAFIRTNILITAAHCVRDINGLYKNFRFFLGYNGMFDKGRPFEIDQVFTHRNYIGTSGGTDSRYLVF